MNQHFIQFRNTQLTCIESNSEFFVAMRPVVKGMGLDWKTQYRKIMNNSERLSVVIMTTHLPDDNQSRKHLFIPLERLFGWLMTIHPSKVKPECRQAVIEYQNECDRVLTRHFINELYLLNDEAQDWGNALFNGWLKRYPKWANILDGLNEGETYQQLLERTGYRAKSTIHRNIQRMREAGVLPTVH